jgi:ferredoxin
MRIFNRLKKRQLLLVAVLVSFFTFVTYKAYARYSYYIFTIDITDCIKCYECVVNGGGLILIGTDGYPYWKDGMVSGNSRYLFYPEDKYIATIFEALYSCPAGCITFEQSK